MTDFSKIKENLSQIEEQAKENPQIYMDLGNLFLRGEGIEHDINKAVEYFQKGSDAGINDASFNLAQIYHIGLGGNPIDIPKAVNLYEKCVLNDDLTAMFNLAMIYIVGNGVPKNIPRGIELLETSAQKGFAHSIYNLALQYLSGENVPYDCQKAIELLETGSEKGYFNCTIRLAILYRDGYKEIPPDLGKCGRILVESAKTKNPDALCSLGEYYEYIGKNTSLIQRSVECYEEAILKNHTRSMYNLANLLVNTPGHFVPRNPKRSIELLTKASELGDLNSMKKLAEIYREKDPYKSLYYYEKGSELGDDDCTYNLALMYQEGEGIPKNKKKALELYQKAASNNHVQALTNLGVMYHYGKGVEKDLNKASEYYEAAAKKGHLNAIYNLGVLYSQDEEMKNIPKALEYFEMARKKGDTMAMHNMALIYLNGNGIEQNVQKAVDICEELIKMNYYKVIDTLIKIYANGKGNVAKKSKRALELCQFMFDNQNFQFLDVAIKLLKEENPPNNERILEILENGAKQNDRFALIELIRVYSEGDFGVAPSEEKMNFYQEKLNMTPECTIW